jgi:hypothetical protein
MRLRMIVTACTVIVMCAASFAVVPSSITIQGKLTDASGIPLPAGNKELTFRVFDQAAGGSEIWPGGAGEIQMVTTGDDGLWIVLLGSSLPLTDSVFADSIRWLEIVVNDLANPTITLPRVRLVSGPFAYRVATVDGASGGTITSKASIGPGHTNTGANAFVAGIDNVVSGDRSTVSGGDGNSATATSATVGGGRGNIAGAEAAVVGGGISNEAGFLCATISGGYNCAASDQFATVGGGYADTASGLVSTVAGGNRNRASGQGSTVAGGDRNTASGQVSAIGGGNANSASGIGSTSAGGISNQAESDYATVSGGLNSIASSEFATVGGGYEDTASGSRATVSGGQWNVASGDWSTVGGGGANYASNLVATVAGGNRSIASGQGSTIGGGEFNRARGSHSVVAGGGGTTDLDSNSASGNGSTVSGGKRNLASGLGSTVGGGESNRAIGEHSTVSGGGSSFDENSNTAEGDFSTVGGGRSNTASGPNSTIAGGAFNRSSGQNGAVGGGSNNFASGELSSVGGGLFNVTTAFAATIAGGELNRADAVDASVGGGNTNIASGLAATIPGGRSNSASGNYALAAGRRAKSLHDGTFVWSDSTNSDFASTGDNQFLIRASGGVGIGVNAPGAPLHVSEGSAGAGTAYTNAVAAFERNGNAYLHLLSPDADENGLLFGTPLANLGGAVIFNSNAVPSGLEFRTNTNDFAVAITAAGRMGIGTAAVSNILTLPNIASVNGQGLANAWAIYSSRRWKTNVATITDPIGKVQRLRGVTYDWKANGKHDVGLIAEEVGDVIPEIVRYEENGVDAQSLDYSRLVAVLIEAVKEQQRRIESLENKLERQMP